MAVAIRIEDITIEGPHGGLAVRTYVPSSPTRGLVWAHGGAFALGGLDQLESDWVARQIAARGIAVIAVDYQLAPTPDWFAAEAGGVPVKDGVRFPVASDEVTAAWTAASGLVPEVDPPGWSLGGASAGANLAAGAALRLRDRGGPQPASLVLAYGLFHRALPPLTAEIDAKCRYSGGRNFTADDVRLINLNYVGDPAHLLHPYAFPGGHDVGGLPPSFLLNSDSDPLRASGQRFASELIEAGNDALVVVEPTTAHGHLDGPAQVGAAQSIERMVAWLSADRM